jgi:phospholipid/cholesterol/gamma-HCH transport system substrate-binding protein
VTYAGKPVGEVVHIKEVPNARSETPDDTGKIYLYELILHVDSSVDVYKNDEIALKTTGLMGEKSVAILPKAAVKGKPNVLVTDQIIYANSVDALENAFTQVSRVANRLEGAIDQFDHWFAANESRLSQVLQSFDGAMAQVDAVLKAVDGQNLIPTLKQSASLLNENLEFVRVSLDEDQLLHKVANLASNLDKAADAFNSDGAEILKNANQISRDISSGTGTLGRFIAGDDFYLRLSSLMNKGQILMNDINHYGILFQYNKQWQRIRSKKATLLNALDTPYEFRNYFEGEIDSMNTSLGRLSELIERANGNERSEIVQSDSFKQNFAALLRQVQGFNDSLKLYNDDLIEQSEH